MNAMDTLNQSIYGLYINDPRFMEELQEVKRYYEFYNGRPFKMKDEYQDDTGQLWRVSERDYTPTREVRNLTKKLMKKQGRFMTSVPPTFMMSAVDGNVSREQLDAKRGIIDSILVEGNFWNKMAKAFMDCTIGKRVLLAAMFDIDTNGKAITDSKIKFRFYTMPEFTYEFDPNDADVLMRVKIAYQDKATVGLIPSKQRWHKYTYSMRDDKGNILPTCKAKYEIVDGTDATAFLELGSQKTPNTDINGNPNEPETDSKYVELSQEWDTGLSCIPCKVIFNDGLTGDTRGNSDIKDLMDSAMNYNKTVSDYRDALRFKMFEQPVFTDCDSNSLAGMKIAPNSVIDLKSDPTLGDGTNATSVAKAEMLSSTFNFQPAVDSYLLSLKKDMYEIMEQPLPEALLNVPSAKALKMIYYDLITRCEEKWNEWDEALVWLVDLIEECIVKFHLYSDKPDIQSITLDTEMTIVHNFPLPDDEEETKKVALQEVAANVRSHKSYIEQFGYAEDADAEFQTILDEVGTFNEVNNAMIGLDGVTEPPQTQDPPKKKEKEDEKKQKEE